MPTNPGTPDDPPPPPTGPPPPELAATVADFLEAWGAEQPATSPWREIMQMQVGALRGSSGTP